MHIAYSIRTGVLCRSPYMAILRNRHYVWNSRRDFHHHYYHGVIEGFIRLEAVRKLQAYRHAPPASESRHSEIRSRLY